METGSTPDEKKSLLLNDLEYSMAGYKRIAKRNYFISQFLTNIIIISTACTAVGKFVISFNSVTTSILAFVAFFSATVALNLKFQDKSNWYYQKKGFLCNQRRRLLFETTNNNLEKNIEEISKAWSKFDTDMDVKWESQFGFSINDYFKKPLPTLNTPPNIG